MGKAVQLIQSDVSIGFDVSEEDGQYSKLFQNDAGVVYDVIGDAGQGSTADPE